MREDVDKWLVTSDGTVTDLSIGVVYDIREYFICAWVGYSLLKY
jgi:hypothetical protein